MAAGDSAGLVLELVGADGRSVLGGAADEDVDAVVVTGAAEVDGAELVTV